jgi:DNA polymerase-3 subunit epsilon
MVDMAMVLDIPSEGIRIEKSWLINPGIEIPLEATAVHGISTETAQEKGISVHQACDELWTELYHGEMGNLASLEDTPVCVYNAAFDIPIIVRESLWNINAGNWLILDPMILDKHYDTYRPGKRTLTATSAAYGLGVRNAHRAIGDVISTISLMRAIGKKYPQLAQKPLLEIQSITRDAYHEQMSQFMSYRKGTDEPDFQCPVEWPYDSAKLNAVIDLRIRELHPNSYNEES